MRFALSVLAPAVAAAVLFAAPAQEARAGDVSNAQLACYVDTYAFDTPRVGICWSFWTPFTADNPSVAVFEVQGLAAGNYRFSWRNPLTGEGVLCPGFTFCQVPIGVGESKRLQVTITDMDTGASKTVVARANYYDGWN